MVSIKNTLIEKLAHSSEEIRARALLHIEAKVKRAFSSDLELDLNPDNLIKNLFQWFRTKPLILEDNVLELMLALIEVIMLYN